jgi:hypothetical protein
LYCTTIGIEANLVRKRHQALYAIRCNARITIHKILRKHCFWLRCSQDHQISPNRAQLYSHRQQHPVASPFVSTWLNDRIFGLRPLLEFSPPSPCSAYQLVHHGVLESSIIVKSTDECLTHTTACEFGMPQLVGPPKQSISERIRRTMTHVMKNSVTSRRLRLNTVSYVINTRRPIPNVKALQSGTDTSVVLCRPRDFRNYRHSVDRMYRNTQNALDVRHQPACLLACTAADAIVSIL